MLVITRKPGESVMIGDIRVEVVSVSGKNIRLGIDAHPDTLILREEVSGTGRQGANKKSNTISLNS